MSQLPAALTIAAIALLFAALFAIERFAPLRVPRGERLGRRVLVNLAVTATAFGTAFLLVRPAAAWALGWSEERPFGLLAVLGLPVWAGGIVAFLLMDLTFYWWHLANHRIPLLWRFHNVHHVDPALDVTTAFRFHFGEVALSAGFRVVQVTVIGLPAAVFAIYETVFQANTLFHHSNVRLPIRVERWLSRGLVTPRMHGIHHSWVREEDLSNFGVVHPFWDRLHRTLRLNVPQEKVRIGIAGYSRGADNEIPRLLALPFVGQRDYWRTPEGTRIARDPADLAATEPSRLAP